MSGKLIENTTVRVATAVALLVFVVGFVWGVGRWCQTDALWKQRIERDVRDLNSKIVGKSPSGWHRWEMRRWVSEARRAHPEIKWPEVDSVPMGP